MNYANLSIEELHWYDKAKKLERLSKVYGVDLDELARKEQEIRIGFIAEYDKFPASLLRKYIVEVVMASERVRIDKATSREALLNKTGRKGK